MTGMADIDILLASYADGELDPVTERDVVAYLAANPHAERTLSIHRDTTLLLRAAYSESQFLASHDRSSTRRARRIALSRYGWALAASVTMGLVGYGAGASWPHSNVSHQERMLTGIAEYHTVYSRETVHLVEVAAAEADHLKEWLGKRVNRALVIPDLHESGLVFAGGRLVVLDGSPVAELMYTRETGLPIALCVLHRAGEPHGVELERRGTVNLGTWHDGSHSYFVVGEAPAVLISSLAAAARKQF